jgi:uncharacterized membrane protein
MIPVQHIHPMIVHFPIVFVFVLAAFDLIATVRGFSVTGRTAVGNVSTGLTVLAALSAIAAYLFGGLALDYAESGGFSSDVAETHEGLGGAVAALLVTWALIRTFLWWRNKEVSGAASVAIPLVAIAGAGLVTATAYYGGLLVFELGVNVVKVAMAG